MKIKLEYVHYMPNELNFGVLYVSNEFKTAAHLCACGCGLKVRTPLAPTEWRLTVSNQGPSLNPSIGNWQLPCRSHYWIINGDICWSNQWTNAQIAEGRKNEELRRRIYFKEIQHDQMTFWDRIWQWVKNFFT